MRRLAGRGVRAAGLLALSAAGVLATGLWAAPTPAHAAGGAVLLRDVRAAADRLTSTTQASTPADYIQPDTQVEPAIAVNPRNSLNAVAGYQEGRVAGGGDATNGYATTIDGGKTWSFGEIPGLTSYPAQGGPFDRASDAVVAFGSSNDVYFSSLVFSPVSGTGLRSGMAINVSRDGG
ncbi:MAG: exo-alpha-sialidase, partial [Candidatus Dormibacteraeota bacterium]|nr:exo-alpha-sialidase [Candidatus Dormibacteraeota bacterium]